MGSNFGIEIGQIGEKNSSGSVLIDWLPLAFQADELVTMEEVVEAAKAGIEFVDNDFVAAR